MRLNWSVKGFTLLEVMVSIAVLSLSLLALINSSGNTLIKSGRAERISIATMLARAKMADIEIDLEKQKAKGEFPDEKEEEGQFDEPYEDYSWKMGIRRVDLPAPVTGESGSLQAMIGRTLTKEISNTVRELKLIVKWEELGEEQTMEIVTHIVKL
jgi:general secretion pathway protein I